MTDNESIEELASEYVLGTLDAQQRLMVQQRLPRDPDLARAVDKWEARLLPLACSPSHAIRCALAAYRR